MVVTSVWTERHRLVHQVRFDVRTYTPVLLGHSLK